MFFGTYRHNLDHKGRMVVPAKFRPVLGNLAYIMRGFEGALEVYHPSAFEKLLSELEELRFTERSARDYMRARLASVVEVEVDDHGRITLPTKVLETFKIGTAVVIIGVQHHFEIWDATAWETYQERVNAHLEEVADRLYE
ncbi:MAG: division/cell wall cluster transcriptional repressor MraZ [Bacilli bacterium]